MQVPIIFIEALPNNDITDLSSDLKWLGINDYIFHRQDNDDYKVIKQLMMDGKLNKTQSINLLHNIILKGIEEKLKEAKEKKFTLVIERNPIYYKWFNLNDEIHEIDGRSVELFVKYNAFAYETYVYASTKIKSTMTTKMVNVYSESKKNTGKIVVVSNVIDKTTWKEKPEEKFVEKNGIIFVDGNIGAGKTTFIQERAKIGDIPSLIEPIDEISEILKMTNNRNIVEKAIMNMTTEKLNELIKENEGSAVLYERNLLYSDWIFTGSSEYPTFDEEALKAINGKIEFTIFINTPMDMIKNQIEKRGRDVDKRWTDNDLNDIQNRLNLLYIGNWEWPYARVSIMVPAENK
jgi:deoxyadenosine/deoxycytidine kinase